MQGSHTNQHAVTQLPLQVDVHNLNPLLLGMASSLRTDWQQQQSVDIASPDMLPVVQPQPAETAQVDYQDSLAMAVGSASARKQASAAHRVFVQGFRLEPAYQCCSTATCCTKLRLD